MFVLSVFVCILFAMHKQVYSNAQACRYQFIGFIFETCLSNFIDFESRVMLVSISDYVE